MRTRIAALALTCGLALAPIAAGAQVWRADEIPPAGASISAADAHDIARHQGLVIVRRVHFDRGWFDKHPRWEVKGRDYRDRDVEMKIDANTGVILDIDR
jgi:hypothetical protein